MYRRTSFLVLTFILVIWEISVNFLHIPKFILPAPSLILYTCFSQAPLLLENTLVTAVEILLGLLISLAISIPLAMVMFNFPSIDAAVTPFLVISQAIPIFALAPLLVVWFGYGLLSKIIMATIVIFFPLTVSLHSGFKQVDPDYEVLFDLLDASFWKKMRLLYWPAALPSFFAGLKMAVAVATIGAVLGEWVGAQKGLGYLMIQMNARLRTDMLFAALVWLSAMGMGLWLLVGKLEKHFLFWLNDMKD